MKQIFIATIAILLGSVVTAQTLPVKFYEITNIPVKHSFKFATGKELNAFEVPQNANSIKISVQVPIKNYKKYVVPNQLQLAITNAKTGETIQNNYWSTLYKDTILITECYFPSGEYNISLMDQVHPETIYASRTITVKGDEKQGGSVIKFNGYSYDVSKFKIWTCGSVDDVNWKAIDQKTKTNTGGCMTFFFESTEKIKNPGTMRWKLYRVEADGKETFVNQRDQTIVLEQFRRMYYEECSEFATPGHYRIYLAIRNESEAYYGVRDKEYFAKADITVE